MTSKDLNILQSFGEKLTAEIKAIVPVSSGATQNSIELEMTQSGFKILGASYIYTLFYGRPPTRSGAPKGTPTLKDAIYSWLQRKGITAFNDKDKEIPLKSLAYVIARSIHQKGNQLYRIYKGKGTGQIEKLINKSRLNSMFNKIAENYILEIQKTMLK